MPPATEPFDEADEEEDYIADEEEEAPQPKRGRASRGPSEPLQGQGPHLELEGTGPIAVPPRELRDLEELMQQYRQDADVTRARFKGNVSRQELDGLVRHVMRHVLFLHSEKPGVPVSRAEVTKLVSGSAAQKKHNMTGLVIALAQHKMLEVFGLELKEITKAPQRGAHKGAAAAAGEGTKHLVLRSAVPPTLLAQAVQDRGEDAVRGFALVLLSLIDLAGGKVTAAELWPMLEELGVREEGPHLLLGRPGEVLEQLSRRRYLNVERQQGPDGEVRLYTIAENALDELRKENIVAFYETEFAREGPVAAGET
ncbi:hypothetical protein N2152v2_005629 [Parachlorella kessleri]